MAEVEVDGTEWQQITEDSKAYRNNDILGYTSGLNWSPDGTRLAFGGRVDGNTDIYVMAADGSNQVRITTGPEIDIWPSWSPDGSRIAFHSERDAEKSGRSDIFVMDADGSNAVNLTNLPDKIDMWPSWSPDGSRIAFSSLRDLHATNLLELYVMDADGSNPTRLTESVGPDQHPSWSPDGSRITFSSMRDGNLEIYVVNADGSNLVRLTEDSHYNDFPSWSPDGQYIAYRKRNVNGGDTIWVMRADGTDPYRLVGFGMTPTWQPQDFSETAIEAISWGLLKANWR